MERERDTINAKALISAQIEGEKMVDKKTREGELLEEIQELKKIGLAVNKALESLMLSKGIRLIDFKLEFGLDQKGEILLADEISPDTCRFWDIESGKILDKDRFRRDLGGVTEAYLEIHQRLTEEII